MLVLLGAYVQEAVLSLWFMSIPGTTLIILRRLLICYYVSVLLLGAIDTVVRVIDDF